MAEDQRCLLAPNIVQSHSLNWDQDGAAELGHYVTQASTSSDLPINLEDDSSADLQQKRWDLNYHEAAIYLQEGENNDKFSTHPSSQAALPAYLITHNTWFYVMDLVASLLLMSLALVEAPHVPPFIIPVAVHSSIELLCLLVIGLELGMRLKWLGPHNYCRHVRTMIKTVTLVIMLCEAIAVLIRQTNHFRVTRSIRPLFLLDSYYCRGVRRFVRQVIQSLPPILDMVLLLLFFMLIFSILGFYLFSSVPYDTYFQTIEKSFISLFILLTTANYPDVMLPAYNSTRWASLFFITYLSLELYLVMNLMLAVVYDAFSGMEKKKLKKLWLHKRTSCQYAFKLLVCRNNPRAIKLKHFEGILKYYQPKLNRRDVYLTFKTLNTSKSGSLTLEEFYQIFEMSKLKWKQKRGTETWSSDFVFPFNRIFKAFNWIASWKWFEIFMSVIISINFIWILADTISISIAIADKNLDPVVNHFSLTWYSIMFVTIYVLEALIKILGLGPITYFSSGWNIFDFIVTLLAVAGILLELINSNFFYIVVLRPFRLLRLFKVKRRFRDVLGTMFILLPRMISLAVVMLLLYYFFAIIGIETFSRYDMKNCCVNTSVEVYYRYNNVTGEGGYYYLNNFANILNSGVTLFELTIVNNWYIIMEGYAAVSTQWSRLYFMVFYIVTMVVMTVVVAFILEAFLFRIQYRNKMHIQDIEDHSKIKVDIGLTNAELDMCRRFAQPLSSHYITQQAGRLNSPMDQNGTNTEEGVIWYRGERMRGKEDFSLKMYQDEVGEWIAEEEEKQRRRTEEMQEISHTGNNADRPELHTGTSTESNPEGSELHTRNNTM